MTIKVCHQKFNHVLDNIAKILFIIIKIGLVMLLPIGLYFVILDPTPSYPDTREDNYYELRDIYYDKYGNTILGTVGIIIGSSIIISIGFISPLMFDEPTWFHRINKKLKLFKWNEDC